MSWRNPQGVTGSNNIPLGARRRFGGDSGSDDTQSRPPPPPPSDVGVKRGRSPVVELNPDGTKKRKKRNRWGDATENKAAGLMGLPTAINANMTSEQLEAYTLHLRIEEISQKLKINDVVPADGDRSPSPPPQYDNFGRRVNTRESRYRKRLEDERHKLIEKAMKVIPNYHPPADYRRPTKTQEKVYVPVNDYPEINFIGLLIGPRGNTLKKMESESGAKIAIRGKGSVKEGKGRSDAAHTSNQEEDLHCLIMADTEEKVNKAKKLIAQVIETAASIPEGQNELKRNQLRELATLNGTLRDDENQACQNCGQIGHRKYDCPEQRNFTANIICRVCGNAGHMARDCPDRQRGSDWRNDRGPPGRGPPAGRIGGGDAVDREYEQLMQELGGGSGAGPQHRIEAGPGGQDSGANGSGASVPPWQQRGGHGGSGGGGGGASAAPWRSRDDRDSGPTGAPPPWASGGHRGGRDNYNNRGDSHNSHRSDNYGGGYNNGYGQQQGSNAGGAPWQQQQQQQGAGAGEQNPDPAAVAAAWQQYYAQMGYSMPQGAAQGAYPGATGAAAGGAPPPPPPPPPPGGDAPPPPPPPPGA